MRLFLLISVLILLFAAAAPDAVARCPVAGMYSTTSSTMLSGRASEAWCGVDGTPGQGEPGNVQNAMSWDGATLGSEWIAWDMTVDQNGAQEIDRNIDLDGNGHITYSINYINGRFMLSRQGAWGDGGAGYYTGILTRWNIVTTVTYVGGFAVGATSNISGEGKFNCTSACLSPACKTCGIGFVIANAILIWQTGDVAVKPLNYPDFLCGADSGELHNVCCVTMRIDCPVANEPASWGAIKALYQ